MGLIYDIPTCADLLKRIEKEAVEAMASTNALYSPFGGPKDSKL
jgi:hypothetical protein